MIFEAIFFVGFLGIMIWKWGQVFVLIRQHGIKTILSERTPLLPGVLALTSVFIGFTGSALETGRLAPQYQSPYWNWGAWGQFFWVIGSAGTIIFGLVYVYCTTLKTKGKARLSRAQKKAVFQQIEKQAREKIYDRRQEIRKQKATFLSSFTPQIQFTYPGSNEILHSHLQKSAFNILALKNINHITNLISRSMNGVSVCIFDYEQRVDRSVWTAMMCVVADFNLPAFHLSPYVYEGKEFPYHSERGDEKYPEFSWLYWSNAQDEKNLHDLFRFNECLITFYEEHPILFTEAGGDYLVICRQLVSVEEMPSFMQIGVEAINRFLGKEFLTYPWNTSLQLQKELALLFGEIDCADIIEPLAKAFMSLSTYVRQHQARLMFRKLGYTEPFDILGQVLRASNRDVRRRAMQQLLKTDDPRIVDLLLTLLTQKDSTIHAAVIDALGSLGDVRAVPQLIDIFQDSTSNLRGKAVEALVKIGDSRALEPLIEGLKDKSEYVREKARNALQTFGLPAAQRLVPFLGQYDYRFREQVGVVLEHIGWTPADSRERIYYLLAKKDIGPLVNSGASIIQQLSHIINENQGEIREEASNVLHRIYTNRIDTVCFGAADNMGIFDAHTVLHNPDVTELTIPLLNLRLIEIDTTTHDFHLVERFLTYAVNYIGQELLKRQVKVHINGDPKQLHQNLRNSFSNLCKRVCLLNPVVRPSSRYTNKK